MPPNEYDLDSQTRSFMDRWLNAKELFVVGESVVRVDGFDKVTGRTKYVADLLSKDILHARIIRSDYPCAQIRRISFSQALSVTGFVGGVIAADVPGQNQVGYHLSDQPLFAQGLARFQGEALGLVIAKSSQSAEDALEKIEVDCKELPAVYDPIEALGSKILVHPEQDSNVAVTTKVRKGDIQTGFSQAKVVVQNTYRTGYQDHAYLEPEAVLAFPTAEGFTIVSCDQYPHLAQRIVAKVLGIEQSRVRVVHVAVGGGFGGKDDMGPILGAQAAVAAHKFRRPVLLVYTRQESFTSHCKRDPAVINYKTGADASGKLTAIEVDIVFDSGAYANRGPFTLWRASVHASGPYVVPNVKVDGKLVYTNKVFQGSFRGFGNPQVQFAAESNMDEVAHELGLDPVEFRLRNLLVEGSTTITGQVLNDPVGITSALKQVALRCSWSRRRYESKLAANHLVSGVGVACAWHGISTSRGVPDSSAGYICIRRDGSVDCYTGIVELGQGTSTGIVQLVAEVLGVPTSSVTVHMGTSDAPDTGATHASRGLSVGSNGILIASSMLRHRLEKKACEMLGCEPAQIVIKNGFVSTTTGDRRISFSEVVKECYNSGVEMSATGYFSVPKGKFDEEAGKGFAYPAFSYIAMVAEVEVDTDTGVIRTKHIWPSVAAGRIINPALANAQIHGASAQGIGYATMEEILVSDGILLAQSFADYALPSTLESPVIDDPVFVEDLYADGPFGAKGIAEMALIPAPAAIMNAVRHATGIRCKEIPLTPPKFYNLLKGINQADDRQRC
jgi:CO/xanthine dehydrogenase Mo-binding subunit